MKNLMTRKIVLGMLMTLVLAFSVQGIAEAGVEITKSTRLSTSHDYQTQVAGRRLSDPFVFVVDDVQETDEDDDDSTTTELNADSIEIDPEGVTITEIRIGSTTVFEGASTSAITLDADNNLDESGLKDGTVSVYCTLASTVGIKMVTVADQDTREDTDDEDNEDDEVTFTAYAVQGRDSVESNVTAIVFSRSTADILYDTADEDVMISLTGSASGYALVNLEINGGSFYVPEPHDTDTAPYSYSTRTDSDLTIHTRNNGSVTMRFRPSSRSNVQITAQVVHKLELEAVKTFYYRDAVLDKVSGDDQTGRPNTQLTRELVVNVENQRGTGVSGQVVLFTFADQANAFSFATDNDDERKEGMFLAVPGTTIYDATAFPNTNGYGRAEDHDSIDTEKASLTVVSGSRGEAKVYVVLTYDVESDEGKQYYQPTATILRGTTAGTAFTHRAAIQRFKATADPGRSRDTRDIRIVSGGTQNVAVRKYADPLEVIVESDGDVVQGAIVEFETNRGVLEFDPDDNFGSQVTITAGTPRTTADSDSFIGYLTTDVNGKASVNYYVGASPGVGKIDATIRINESETPTTRVTFTVNVGGARDTTTRQPTPSPDPEDTITITPSNIEGEPGDEVEIVVTSSPSNVLVTINSGELDDDDFSPRLLGTTPFETTIILPSEEDTYTFSAVRSGYREGVATVTVESEEEGTLSIEAVGNPVGGQQTIRVTVRDADGDLATVPVDVTLTGTGINRTVPTTRGSGAAVISVPNTVSVRADGYRSDTLTLTGTGQTTTTTEQTTTTTTTTTTTGGEPDRVSIVGPSQRDGTANTALDAALIVQVVDDDGDEVADARVIFRVRTGQGRLSDRGNGRAVAVQTDSSGYARATYTPISASSTVEAEVRGVTRSVTFTITASGGSTTTTTRDTGTGTTPGTISPTVLVGAANRPPMIWVDGGAIYALVGASVERFAPSVDNAQNLAVGGGKIYWTEATGESGGTINSANLNGSGVTELASILATPMGIAVDTAGSKLYWTNSRGKIQNANLDGSGITDMIPGGLEGAMDIALAGGNAYWTQGGNVRFVNLRGQKQIRNISTGTDTAGSLAIADGKVYWTEATGESGGTVNSANLNGSGATQLASILATPNGIAVDTSRSKLLWTNARGRIQSANLDGSGITNVVDGLGSPGDMVLSNSITAPTTATTTTTTTTTADNSKYDVNNDGSVDNTDASLVAAAMNTSNTRYDVNGDGTVNFLDLLLVFDNRDPGAAGAPTIVGMKLTAVQVDVLQEQIHLLIATGDRSPAAMRTLVYLQQLIATARPEQTQLLANYPNPFNPETWIPYELATDTDVRLTIYNMHGVVIRTLELGHQSSGYYVGRDRAAYWDGRNAFGEQVASGIYFYQFETDEMSTMRKMVILK